jgi:hypothetical protein
MEEDRALAKLKAGIWVSWLSLVILPLGVFLGAVGICAGPSSKNAAVVMLAVGACGMIAAMYGGFNVLRGIQLGPWPLRIFSLLSLCSAALVGLVGWLYAFEARDYLDYVLRSGR